MTSNCTSIQKSICYSKNGSLLHARHPTPISSKQKKRYRSPNSPVHNPSEVSSNLPPHLGSATATAFAYDPSPLQDFCVAINDPKVFVNGKFFKDPKQVTADDFLFKGFRYPGNTANPLGSKVTPAFVDHFPGLNTLGISMARIDFAPGGLDPPHTHPRGSEILVVAEGTLLVAFVTSNQFNSTIFTKVLYKGDVFAFPIGLIHFQLNIGKTPALALAALSSQNPGVMTVANAVFGSKPPISADVLTKAFQVDKKVVDYLQAQFWYDN